MTTFTSEDRINASKLVEEAPYHPGYEDAVVVKPNYHENEELLAKEINELFKVKNRHIATSKKIIDFLKSGQKWDR